MAALLPIGWQLVNSTGLSVNGQTITGSLPAITVGGQATLVLTVQAGGVETVKAQIQTATPADSDSTPGNGYDNGEDNEAQLSLRVLN